MSKIHHQSAQKQAHELVAILWDELPSDWHDAITDHQNEVGLWLAGFAYSFRDFRGFALLREARLQAELYYQNIFRLTHHSPQTWAFFRFRLEVALLRSTGANQAEIMACYGYHDITAGFAARIDLSYLN
ncbi:hypothetical protein [Spirosoma sp. KNUC1025]|uniref:hypothetical protein n=1 Tax=Spirosoma sp. KNUC1025 TaxID=2894082 RepID=UPI00386D10F2|nr:hypothetical protein LN737_19065 [Spirosoma sp. KNUC1025]